MVFWITAYHATCPNLIWLVPTTWQMNLLQNPIKFDLMHSLDMGRVVPKCNPFVPKLQPILGQWVCCWKELLAEWGSLSRNKKEGKRARLLLDDKNEDLPVDLLSVDVHSHCLKRFREREMSSPSHFLLRVGRVFCIPTRVGHPELIHLFIGRDVLVQICENLFTNYSSLLWRAVSGLWPAGKLHITECNPQMSMEIFLLNPSRCSVVWLSPSAHSINFILFFLHVFSVLAYTGTSFPFRELLIIAI